MNEILLNSGVELNSIVLLLLLPISATIIGITRHIIGFRSLGIYLALLMTFLMYELGNSNPQSYSDIFKGMKYAYFMFFFIFIFTIFAYKITKRLVLHYYAKLSIIITIVTTLLLLLITILGLIGYKGFITLNTFTLLLIVGLSEKFLSIIIRKKLKSTIIISFESIAQATFCYILIAQPFFIDALVNYPYLIILLFPINYFVGRYADLRLTELYRFRKVLNDLE